MDANSNYCVALGRPIICSNGLEWYFM